MKKLQENEMKSMIVNIRKHTKDYITKNNIKALILGVSGGIDSALVAALLKPVCDELNIPLVGRSITIGSNKEDEIARSIEVGNSFCHSFSHVNLTSMFDNIKYDIDLGEFEEYKDGRNDELIEDDYESYRTKIRWGNIKARMRMIYLYNLASLHKGLVLSTDNLTEYNLGFSSIMGDWGDFGIMQFLWKSEVYQLSEYLCNVELSNNPKANYALYSCIVANATDGLGISNTDLDQLLPDWKERHTNTKSGYEEVDDILYNYIHMRIGDLNHIVIKKHNSTHFKRNWPITLKRDEIFK